MAAFHATITRDGIFVLSLTGQTDLEKISLKRKQDKYVKQVENRPDRNFYA